MQEVLKRSRLIAVLVFLCLVFHLFVRIYLQKNYISEYSFMLLTTGIHMFVYILFLIYVRMICHFLPSSSSIRGLLVFGAICYIFLTATELVSLRIAGTDFEWNFDKVANTGERIALSLYLVAYAALTVFYVLLGKRLPAGSARVACFFVAATQLFTTYILVVIDYYWHFNDLYGHQYADIWDDFTMYLVTIWFLWLIPSIPIREKQKFA